MSNHARSIPEDHHAWIGTPLFDGASCPMNSHTGKTLASVDSERQPRSRDGRVLALPRTHLFCVHMHALTHCRNITETPASRGDAHGRERGRVWHFTRHGKQCQPPPAQRHYFASCSVVWTTTSVPGHRNQATPRNLGGHVHLGGDALVGRCCGGRVCPFKNISISWGWLALLRLCGPRKSFTYASAPPSPY